MKTKSKLLKQKACEYPDLINYLKTNMNLYVSSNHTVEDVLDLIRDVENGEWDKKFSMKAEFTY